MAGMKHSMSALMVGSLAGIAASSPAAADDWWKDVKFSGYVEAGGLVNTDFHNDPNKLNWGHLFTDKANELQLNQLSLTAERAIDPKKSYDVGFKFQGLYGSDARYTHFLGELDRVTSDKNQLDIVEAWMLFHTPFLGEGGTDIKVGQYVTLEGAEVIDPRGNFFYSHSYIFNFGIPFKHTGVLATSHVNPMLDLYYGIDTGVNTTFGKSGDNNGSVAFHGGIGLNLMNGDLAILATTHVGPELPDHGDPGFFVTNPQTRYLNDVTIVWKATKQLTVTADLNYIRDDTPNFAANTPNGAEGYGAAGYLAYTVGDQLSLGLRGEVWRDSQGAFVGAFPGNFDFLNAQQGRVNGSLATNLATTYVAVTAGANIKPTVPKDFEGLVIRPEIRWDHSSETAPFNGGTSHDQVTLGADVVIPFALSH